MPAIKVAIVRWVDDHQPGFVECKLTDRLGRDWFFVEKLPVVSDEILDRHSTYPRPGVIACEVTASGRDELGRQVAQIDTERPWDITSVEGVSRFDVLADRLMEITPYAGRASGLSSE